MALGGVRLPPEKPERRAVGSACRSHQVASRPNPRVYFPYLPAYPRPLELSAVSWGSIQFTTADLSRVYFPAEFVFEPGVGAEEVCFRNIWYYRPR